jgi:hypothetical protein
MAAAAGSSSFVIIAHRGDSSAAPENTTEAFDLALAQGFPNIETDCQLSADGVPIVLHDETLGRVNNGSGPAAAASLAQLQQLDAGSWFGPQFAGAHIPTLQHVLGRYRGTVHLHLVRGLCGAWLGWGGSIRGWCGMLVAVPCTVAWCCGLVVCLESSSHRSAPSDALENVPSRAAAPILQEFALQKVPCCRTHS